MVSTMTTIDTRHEDMIHDAQLDYYGKRLATASSDRTIKIFDVLGDKHTIIAELNGHEGPVWQVAWAHPKFGNVLASCSYDRRIIIWKESGNQWVRLHEYTGHTSSVNSISWAPHEHGLLLAGASSDGFVSVISSKGDGVWESQKFPAHQIGVNAISWAPAATPGALVNPSENPSSLQPPVKRFVTGGCDNLVKIWRFSDGENQWKVEDELAGHSDWVRDVAWAPSIGLPTSTIASASQDAQVIVWTQESGQDGWKQRVLAKFNDVAWRVSWSVTGNILAASTGDNHVTLWKESLEGDWNCISDLDENSQISADGLAANR
eukprot:Opistho-2@37094